MRSFTILVALACSSALWVTGAGPAAGSAAPALARAGHQVAELDRAKPRPGTKRVRPRVTRVAPASGPTAGGTRVVISGRNLARPTRVTVGGRTATVLAARRNRIVIRTPEAPTCVRTVARVVVRTKAGASRVTKRTRFTYAGRVARPAVAAGNRFSVALRRDGAVLAWGAGQYGVLGQGNEASSSGPVRVKGLGCIVAITAGASHAAALTAGGQVWSWGAATAGQAGDGRLGVRLLPSRALLDVPVVQISAAGDKTVARTADGSVLGWGWETAKEFGGGRHMTKLPVRLTSLRQVRDVFAGASNVLVVRHDRTLWGLGAGPALGLDAAGSSALPRQVGSLGGVARVRVGLGSVNAVTADGSLWGWGVNDGEAGGALGLGFSGPPVRTPTTTSLTDVIDTAGISPQGLALRSDGTVWGWGACTYCDPAGGAPGDGTRLAPTQVPGVSGAVGIATANGRFHALHADGRVSVWGYGWVLPGGDYRQTVRSATLVPGLDLVP